MSHFFEIDRYYDYSKSSEWNYASPHAPFVGEYVEQRSLLDYSYHTRYSESRQLLQDSIVNRFPNTLVRDKDGITTCDHPIENWIVFTSGPMGAGKGHTMTWLNNSNLFPLDAFVDVDPDKIRDLLPEMEEYNRRDPSTMGFLTQKEVGHLTEILTYKSLGEGKNVVVGGSLRDAYFYQDYFNLLREKFPILKIAILNVRAKVETVLKRAAKRADVTGRIVPDSVIIDSMEQSDQALELLKPHTDFFCVVDNEENFSEPRLRLCEMRDSKQGQRMLWTIRLEADEDGNDKEKACNSSSSHLNRSDHRKTSSYDEVDKIQQGLDEVKLSFSGSSENHFTNEKNSDNNGVGYAVFYVAEGTS
eukprot:gene28642-37621_t